MVNASTELVVWDWNGTLIDDTALCYEIGNDMLEERGLPRLGDVEDYKRAFGFPVVEYYRRMGYTFETETYEETSSEFVRLYAERFTACPLQPRAKETIAAIHELGIRQVLLSATGEEKLLGQVAAFDMLGCFDRIIGVQDTLSVGKADRARDFFKEAAIEPARVLMLGDTDHDAAIAKELGCRCALLIPGHQPLDRLMKLGVPLLCELSEALLLLGCDL